MDVNQLQDDNARLAVVQKTLRDYQRLFQQVIQWNLDNPKDPHEAPQAAQKHIAT